MDVFIRDALAAFLKSNPKYEFNVVVEDAVGVVAMYIISAGIFVKSKGSLLYKSILMNMILYVWLYEYSKKMLYIFL